MTKASTYSGATKIRRYLLDRWAEDIAWRKGDAPEAYSASKLERHGMRDMTGGMGAAIIWEGFYAWTSPFELEVMQNILSGTGLRIFLTAEWMIEII